MFGDHHYENLPEEVVSILVDNGVGEAQWQQALAQTRRYEQFHSQRAPIGIIRKALKAAGIAGSVVGTLLKAWNGPVRKREENLERGTKLRKGNIGQRYKGRSFLYLRCRA